MMDPGSIKPFYESWQFWWQTLMMIGIAGNWIYSWWTSREKVSGTRFETLEKEMSQRVTDTALKEINAAREARCLTHLDRTGKLELIVTQNRSDINNLPGHTNLNKIHGRVDAVQKELSTMGGKIEAISSITNLIYQHLLEGDKK